MDKSKNQKLLTLEFSSLLCSVWQWTCCGVVQWQRAILAHFCGSGKCIIVPLLWISEDGA